MLSTMSSGKERRVHDRVDLDFRVVERSGDATYFQSATNLSEGGLFLEGTLAQAPGTPVTLIFRVPGREAPLSIPGEVVGAAEGEPGQRVRFVLDDDPELKQELREFLDGLGTVAE